MEGNNNTIISVIIFSLVLATFFVLFIVILMFIYQKRQNAFKKEISFMKKDYGLQLIKTQSDAQEDMLSEISRKLHHEVKNNIDAVTLQLKNIVYQIQNNSTELNFVKKQLEDIANQNDFVKQQVRLTSHSLMPERIEQVGLLSAIENEIIKFEKSTNIEIIANINRKANYTLTKEESTFVFRLFQETIANVVNHAQASTLKILLGVENNHFFLIVNDDGIGFDENERRKTKNAGIGLMDLKRRAEYINADYTIKSKIGEGTTTKIKIALQKQNV